MIFLATTDNGFEHVLLDELREVCQNITVLRMYSGRILFEAPTEEGLRALLMSRIVNNFYAVIAYFEDVKTLDDIYRLIKGIDFRDYIEPQQSFAIRPERIGEHSFTSIDIARVAGQAIIDSYLASTGVRLRVDLENPDVEIYTELNQDKLIVALSLTRTSLHKRGYKVFNHPAALKTTIASALLRLAAQHRDEAILDPMCGGGTIVIEASLRNKDIPTSCFRLKEFRENNVVNKIAPKVIHELEKLCEKTMRNTSYRGIINIGIDINPRFIEGAILNAKSAGVDDSTLFMVGDSRKLNIILSKLDREIELPRKSVFNPPYGHRMKPSKKLSELYIEVLNQLIDLGFEKIVFITSAIRVSEHVLDKIRASAIRRMFVVHGTLPSYVYVVEI